MASSIKKTVLLGLMLFCLSGCGGVVDYFFLSPPEDTAQELAEAGTSALQNQEYGRAIRYFTQLKDRYPFSPFTPQAELNLADAYFLDEQYMAAATAYKEFEALHPGHEAITYVLFKIGVSRYMEFQSIDRPQDNISEALQYLNRVKASSPESDYAKQADEYIGKCRRLMAEHEVYVADFYWRSGNFGAAWKRYEYISKNFKDLPDILEYATNRSQLAYFQHLREKTETEREVREGTWKNMLDWL